MNSDLAGEIFRQNVQSDNWLLFTGCDKTGEEQMHLRRSLYIFELNLERLHELELAGFENKTVSLLNLSQQKTTKVTNQIQTGL